MRPSGRTAELLLLLLLLLPTLLLRS